MEAAARPHPAAPDLAAPMPVWMWPNLLSLDAPLLAVAWQILFARSFGAGVNAAQAAVLAMYVWLVYVADRTLDGLRTGDPSHDTARHRFYRKHWTKILPAFLLVAAAAAYLSLTELGPALLAGYLWLAAAGTIYFAVVHLMPARMQHRWPKEMAVAILFAAGVCMPNFAAGQSAWRFFAPAFALFSGALWINALGIECWEHRRDRAARGTIIPLASRALAINLEAAAWATAAAAATLAVMHPGRAGTPPLYASIAASAAILGTIEWSRNRLGKDAMRVLADAALLTPILAMLLMR